MSALMNQPIQKSTPAAERGRCKIRNDIIFILSLLLIVSLVGAGIFFLRGEGDMVKVTVDGALYGAYPLYEDAVVEIRTGKDGEQLNVLVIQDGEAYVKSATCPDGICVRHRPVSRDGESIACLPHKVAITVYAVEDDVDIVIS